MHTFSLNDSPNTIKLQQQISNSQITKDYLQKKSDKYLEYLDQLLEESDPKRQYEKIVANRLKEKIDLEKENIKLLETNKFLEDQLRLAHMEIKRLSQQGTENSPNQKQYNMNRMQQQSPNNSNSSSSSQQHPPSPYTNNPSITPLYQHQNLQQIQALALTAKQLAQNQHQALDKSFLLMQKVFYSLERLFQLYTLNSKIAEIDQQDREMILVSREKYLMLVDSFVKGRVGDKVRGYQQEGKSNIKQFDSSQSRSPKQQKQILTNSKQLQTLFTQLAQQCNLTPQWQSYLLHRKTQGQQLKLQLDNIIKGSVEEIEKIDKNITMINESTLSSIKGKLDITQAQKIIQTSEQQIQQQLFKKLHKIIQKLQFTQQQKQLFRRFDQKRKCGRLFSIEEFIQKFKSKQDIHEISKQYTTYIIRTINLLVIKIMEVLTQKLNDSLNPESSKFPWIMTKLDLKSTKIKEDLMAVLEKQFSAYLQQKHPAKVNPLKQRKVIKPIAEPVFDKEKELQKQLIKIVFEYRDLVQSCVVNPNRSMMVKLL